MGSLVMVPVLIDIKDMPNFNPVVKNGLTSVSEGKIYWTEENKVTCREHGACLCLNKDKTLWRCPTCNEGAYVTWIKKTSSLVRPSRFDAKRRTVEQICIALWFFTRCTKGAEACKVCRKAVTDAISIKDAEAELVKIEQIYRLTLMTSRRNAALYAKYREKAEKLENKLKLITNTMRSPKHMTVSKK